MHALDQVRPGCGHRPPRRDPPRRDLLPDLPHFREVRRRHFGADLAEPDAVVLQVEDRVPAARERACEHLLDRVVHGRVDALQRARQHLRAEVRLVGVDADPPHVLLLRSVEHAEAAAARHLEDDVRAGCDLAERGLLALGLVDPVL